MYTALTNGIIITEEGLVYGHALLLEDDAIAGLVPRERLSGLSVGAWDDMEGQYISPGFIDIHSDMIEQIISPRPSCMMDFEMAIKEGEKQLLSQGITTMYHSLSLYRDSLFGVKQVRTASNVTQLAALIGRLHGRSHLIRHRFHARYEIDNVGSMDLLRGMIEDGLVHELSIMDHTPGQGQYRDLDIYRRQIGGYRDAPISEEEWQAVLRMHREKEKPTLEELSGLVELALSYGIPVSSHDDDTVEKVELVHSMGVGISEFPVTMEAARHAKRLGMLTVGGAPNVLLGGSHAGNISVAEAIGEGMLDVLCSDYYPAAMLHAVFLLHNKHGLPLHRAVNLVSANPARAMGIGAAYGSIAPGKKADLICIREMDGYPVITGAYIGGQRVLRLDYRRGETQDAYAAARREAKL